VGNNIGFLKQCLKRIPEVNFVDESSQQVYVQVRRGVFNVLDPSLFAEQLDNLELRQIFAEIAPRIMPSI
jgi:hypothetical protein